MKKLRELLGKRTALVEKLDTFELEGKSVDELGKIEKDVEKTLNEIKSLDLQISVARAKIAPSPAELIELDDGTKPAEVKGQRYWQKPEYKEAFLKYLAGGEIAPEYKAMITTNNSAVIPETTFNLIIQKLEQTNVLFPLVRKSFVKGSLRVPIENASEAAVWGTAEGTAVTEEALTTGSITFNANELNKLVSVSKLLLNESISALESFIVDEITRKFGVAIDNAIVNGTGTNQPKGLLVDALITNTVDVDFSTLDSTAYDAIMDIIAALPSEYDRGAVIMMSKKTFYSTVKKIKDNEGNPIFHELRGENPVARHGIDGIPVVLSDYFPTYAAVTEDNPFMIYGNMKYYHMNISKDFGIESSKDSRFRERLVDFLGTMYADGKVLLGEAFVKVIKDEVA